MNKYIYTIGAFTLALAISGLPIAAFAERDGIEDDGGVQVRSPIQVTDASTSVTARIKEQEDGQEDRSLDASVSSRIDDDETPARSFDELKQTIEKRKQQFEQEVASTTSENRNIAEHANPVRLAVHSLLASKALLGGIGPRVSELARQMNDSVATTTNAEAKIQSRGFFARFLFGGDRGAANAIAQAVAQNQQHIDELSKLLAQANVPADIQAVLTAQIGALQDAQTRLEALAQKEQGAWGLFSWRF